MKKKKKRREENGVASETRPVCCCRSRGSKGAALVLLTALNLGKNIFNFPRMQFTAFFPPQYINVSICLSVFHLLL